MNIILIAANVISIFSQVFTTLVLASVILSYFMDPSHPIRQFVDQLVDPVLAPVRRIVPTVGMIDFSPAVLIILVQLLTGVIISLLYSLR